MFDLVWAKAISYYLPKILLILTSILKHAKYKLQHEIQNNSRITQ